MEVADYAGGDGYEVISDWTQAEYQAYMRQEEGPIVRALVKEAAAELKAHGYDVPAQAILAWVAGGTTNVRFTSKKDRLSYSQLRAMLPNTYMNDPFTFNHHGYRSLDQLLKVWHSGHWVADPHGVEFHVNPAGPLNPLHWFRFIAGLFGSTWEGTYQCAPTVCK